MTHLVDVFSRPHNWCDRRCERCPLADECEVHQHSNAELAAGKSLMESLTEALAKTEEILRRAAAEDGIDFDAPVPPPVVSLKAAKLDKVSFAMVRALGAAQRTPRGNAPALRRLRDLSMPLTSKIGRIAMSVDDANDDSPEYIEGDLMPNIILIEHIVREFREGLALVDDKDTDLSSVRQHFAELDALLAPLFAEVSVRARTAMTALISAGVAPSPFCTVTARPDRERDLLDELDDQFAANDVDDK